jgi:hypothetical protein
MWLIRSAGVRGPSLALCVDRGEVFRAFVVFIIMSGASYTISR